MEIGWTLRYVNNWVTFLLLGFLTVYVAYNQQWEATIIGLFAFTYVKWKVFGNEKGKDA